MMHCFSIPGLPLAEGLQAWKGLFRYINSKLQEGFEDTKTLLQESTAEYSVAASPAVRNRSSGLAHRSSAENGFSKADMRTVFNSRRESQNGELNGPRSNNTFHPVYKEQENGIQRLFVEPSETAHKIHCSSMPDLQKNKYQMLELEVLYNECPFARRDLKSRPDGLKNDPIRVFDCEGIEFRPGKPETSD